METEVISIIRCGTEVPGTETGKNGDGTPIFYPSTITCTANR
jgi:hypothetical protein